MATAVPSLQNKTASTAEVQEAKRNVEVASQWKLMWWKFRKDKLAIVGSVVVIFFYTLAAFAEFFAPKSPEFFDPQYVYAPPQPIFLFLDGQFSPFVYGLKFERDPKSLKKTWAIDYNKRIPIGLFVEAEPYRLLGLIPWDVHLFGPKDPKEPFYLLGADKSGRDMLSRIIHASRISLTVGLVGVFLSLIIGVTIGGISGLLGGIVDVVIQRIIEIVNSVPSLPIMMALAAIVPPGTPPVQVYLIVTLILALLSWTGMARVVRGRFLALREEDFILAARLDGASRGRLIFRHMVPSFLSHLIASVTISIPYMILSETGLSFLGIGLRPPVVSWGVMLRDSQQIAAVANYPWLLLPAAAVVIFVLSMNFTGNGLRDAADPYAN
ncbi:MAG: ABC transporter permease [Anaerolineae bacterium]|nr:ABC transporter permease [Thermoflexales bacterium]MDW8408053.1 ABC transporter permease [Anaerolineae bacterium]